ncbi:MAG TPA: alpha/beta hydrolase [Pseudonocardiaceae bacterium]|nr:alpha/beta hydrolase [Pseudonocardiaceae bacterium]
MAGLVDVGGTDIWLDDRPGADPPVVLVHAGWANSAAWDGVVDRLSGTRRTIRYDNRAYGQSPPPASAFTWRADLLAVLDRLAVDRVILVGHSGGGAAALGLALDHPRRVERLVLIAPGVDGYPWPATDYGPRFMALYEAGDRAGLVELGLRTWAAADPGPAARAVIEDAVDAMLAIGEYEQADPPIFERLGEITTPTRLLLGEHDDPMVADCVRAVAAALPDATLTVVPGADHLLPMSHPELVVAAI